MSATVSAAAMPRAARTAAALVCLAICVAPLAALFDSALTKVGVLIDTSDRLVAAGVPGDKLWTSVLCLCSLAAGCCVALLPPRVDEARLVKGVWRHPERLASVGLALLPIIALASLVWRWVLVDHARDEYLDVMLRGFAYWAALGSLALSAAVLARRYCGAQKAFLITIIAASTIAAAFAVQDYLVTVFVRHIAGWREFGTSTPDFFAALLLVTLPICFGAFLAATSRDSSLAYGFCTALQLAALPTTGSRFALISLVLEALVFAAGFLMLRRSQYALPPGARAKMIAVAVLAVIGGAVFAGPVLHRLQAASLRTDANSGAFRVYTWRGALKLAEAHPVLGTGPDTFQYDYPRYATTGFTRLAHSGYLQLLDELGPLGVLCMLMIAGCATAAAVRSLGARKDAEDVGGDVRAPSSEPLILIGLASGTLGLCIQNFIDSDWMVTICGATWFAAVGLQIALAAGLRQQSGTSVGAAYQGRAAVRWGVAACSLIVTLCCCKWVAGGWHARQGGAGSAYASVPLDGEYAGVAGMALASDPEGADAGGALALLRAAARLTPSPTAYRRLADLQNAQGDPAAAFGDVQAGLRYDPHDLSLLMLGAQIREALNDPAGALGYYRQMAQLQSSPYGKVPAIGGVTDMRYAIADAALAADASRRGDSAAAIVYGNEARKVYNDYLAEGGPSSAMRSAMSGAGSASENARLQSQYSQAMAGLADAYARSGHSGAAAQVRAEAEANGPKFIPKPPAPAPAG